MDNNKPKVSPKDFFLHLGVMVALYAVIIALLRLLFKVINVAYPQVTDYGFFPSSSISLQVAILIIVFPILVFLSILVGRTYQQDTTKKQLWVRRWLWMLTLFAAGIALVGDLVTLLYYFLDGRELTTAFVFKVLSVLIVSAGVFGYVLQDLRDRLHSQGRKIWVVITALALLAAIILGFSVIGSPQTQRLRRYDDQKVNDLSNLQYQVLNYWQTKGELPPALGDLNDSLSGQIVPKDQQTGEDYGYQVGEPVPGKNIISFQLCADFNLKDTRDQSSSGYVARPWNSYEIPNNENWNHDQGHICFNRVIDPELYPVNERGPVKVMD